MKYLRYLRIAFSITCGLACVLLVVLWVRSYWYLDELTHLTSRTHAVSFTSIQGQFTYYLAELNPAVPLTMQPHGLESDRATSGYAESMYEEDEDWVLIHEGVLIWTLRMPHWALAIMCVACAAIPWRPKRFSLRMLLIAMTLVAVVLGGIAYAMRLHRIDWESVSGQQRLGHSRSDLPNQE